MAHKRGTHTVWRESPTAVTYLALKLSPKILQLLKLLWGIPASLGDLDMLEIRLIHGWLLLAQCLAGRYTFPGVTRVQRTVVLQVERVVTIC